MAADSIQGRLTAKVGPLPVWAWAAVIVGAYMLYSHLHAQKASGATTADTGQPGMTAGGIDTGAGAGAAGGSAGLGNPADNLTADQLAMLGGSLGSLQTSIDTLNAGLFSPLANTSTDTTGQASGGGTSSGLFPYTYSVSEVGGPYGPFFGPLPPGGIPQPIGSPALPAPPLAPAAAPPAPQTKLGQTLTAAGVGGHAGSGGFVVPFSAPPISQVFSVTQRAPSSKLAPAGSGTAVHKALAV